MGAGATRREFLIGGALAATAAICVAAAPRRASPLGRGQSLDKLIPDRVGPWTASTYDPILIPQGDTGEGSTYDKVVSRYYLSPTQPPVMFLIAYGAEQAGETQLHRPEACYPAAGFSLQHRPDVVLEVPGGHITARSLTAFATGRTDQILYWTRIGTEFPTTSFDQRLSVLRQTLGGSIPDGVLVRISVESEDPQSANRTIAAFTNALLSTGNSNLRKLLRGHG
jgi:EpsI family protein